MPLIKCRAGTTARPELVRRELTNFTDLDRRLAVFGNLDRNSVRVHDLGQDWAEVTEGSTFAGGVWERLRYDWSRSDTVVLTVLASNTFAAGSTWTYQLHPADHGTEVTLTVDRCPASLKGRLLAVLLILFGRRVFAADLRKSLRRIEESAP